MKKKILAFGLIFAMAASGALGGLQPATPPVTALNLAWDLYTPPGLAASFNIYSGTNSGNYTSVTNVPPGTAIQATIVGLPRGTPFFFAATVVTTNNLESPFSTEVTYTFPTRPVAPGNFRVVSASN